MAPAQFLAGPAPLPGCRQQHLGHPPARTPWRHLPALGNGHPRHCRLRLGDLRTTRSQRQRPPSRRRVEFGGLAACLLAGAGKDRFVGLLLIIASCESQDRGRHWPRKAKSKPASLGTLWCVAVLCGLELAGDGMQAKRAWIPFDEGSPEAIIQIRGAARAVLERAGLARARSSRAVARMRAILRCSALKERSITTRRRLPCPVM
jgi:hypothetical protein